MSIFHCQKYKIQIQNTNTKYKILTKVYQSLPNADINLPAEDIFLLLKTKKRIIPTIIATNKISNGVICTT